MMKSELTKNPKESDDLLVNAIQTAANAESEGARLESMSIALLAYIEENYIGDLDAAGKTRIIQEAYKIIEQGLQGAKS
jgi:hypothetical protein